MVDSIAATSLLGHRPIFSSCNWIYAATKHNCRLSFTKLMYRKDAMSPSVRRWHVKQPIRSMIKAQAAELTREAHSYRKEERILKDSLKRESGSKVPHANIQASKGICITKFSHVMGGRKSSNSACRSRPRGSMTLREESTGKRHGNVNAKTMCKIDHLKDLTLWAAVEASVPSLGAFFGERLSATNEALGVRGDPSLFVCERCESILQPGKNCTVRIEKNKKSKGRHGRKRSKATVQNNIVYRCHFCSHQNMMRGTPNGYVKEICPAKPKPAPNLKKLQENHPSSGNATTTVECREMDSNALLPLDGQNLEGSSLASPLPKAGLSLLDSKRRKRNRCGAKKVDEPQISSAATNMEKSTQTSSKRRKKTWTSLKEITESSGQDVGKKFIDLTVPFFI